MSDKFTEGDIGNPLWTITDGKPEKAWITNVFLDNDTVAVCEYNKGGYAYIGHVKRSECFLSYYQAKKALKEAQGER